VDAFILAVTQFRYIGAPAIAFAEMAATVEAIFLFIWLNRRLPEKVRVSGSLVRGLAAGVFGAVVAYNLALKLPGGAVVTAMIGLITGGLIAMTIVWKDVRQLFNL
jgi:hypothetical protein